MDWKSFYRDELASPAGRAAAFAALARWVDGDNVVTGVLRRGGVVSFPHVTIHDSAEPIARVVQSIRATRARRVVALGVLHGGTLQVPYRGDLAEFHRGSPRAAEIFGRLGGAFVERGPVHTPLGDLDEGPAPRMSEVVRENSAVLAQEFSLDLFLAVLAAAGRGRDVAPPAVTRVFVSVTRDPGGSFASASTIADAVRSILDSETVCVATGDLVHFGHGYTPLEEMAGMPCDSSALEACLRPRIDAMHEAALGRGDYASACATASEIRSDQRNLLPVIAELLGRGARADMISFRLSDYAGINGVAPPCFVASALVGFRRRVSSSPDVS